MCPAKVNVTNVSNEAVSKLEKNHNQFRKIFKAQHVEIIL